MSRMSWFLSFLVVFIENPSTPPVVIAHRGASGYAVEHTEAAKAMAHAQGADFLEQDVVLSKDGIFVVSHDITMEETTDVESVFPKRARSDGKYYFADFEWSEIQRLQMHDRTRRKSEAITSSSETARLACQRVVSLADESKLISGWNEKTGRSAGLYIELKSPSFHKREFGYAMGEALLKLLETNRISSVSDKCFIQCFEPEELVDLHDRLHCKIPLIQLLGKRPSDQELAEMARYAKGIGPSLELLAVRDSSDKIVSTGIVESAKRLGMLVHPYTVRKNQQPKWSNSLGETHQTLIQLLKVDGFFSDYPDLSRAAAWQDNRSN